MPICLIGKILCHWFLIDSLPEGSWIYGWEPNYYITMPLRNNVKCNL